MNAVPPSLAGVSSCAVVVDGGEVRARRLCTAAWLFDNMWFVHGSVTRLSP